MKINDFKNSLYYNTDKRQQRYLNMEKDINLIDKQLSTISFGITEFLPKQYHFYFKRNPISGYMLGNKKGDALFSQTIEYLENEIFYANIIEATVLKVFARLFYISMTKNTLRLSKPISKEEYKILSKTLEENPEYLKSLKFIDPKLEEIEACGIKKLPISLDFKETATYKTNPSIFQDFVENHANNLLNNSQFGIFIPPADDSYYVLKNVKLPDNPVTKTLTVTALQEAVAYKVTNPGLSEKDKANYKAFLELLCTCAYTDSSYSTRRMDCKEMTVNSPKTDFEKK